MSLAWIGLGSNLDRPDTQVETALKELELLPQTWCVRQSALYRSAPLGPQDQPDFCNAVAEIETRLSPLALLRQLQQIEDRHQRQRGRRWGPRTLDMDLLLYAQRILDTIELQLPHPHLHERAFVLQPMAELEPTLTVPGHGPVEQLLAQLDEQPISLWHTA